MCGIVGAVRRRGPVGLELVNKVFKALSDPTRRRVLQLLRQRPMTAGELADHFTVSKPTMSAHFAVLRETELVDADKQGTTITYRLKMSVLEEALMGFAQVFGLAIKPDGTLVPADGSGNEEATG